MKILISGCSFSAGYGFPNEIDDEHIWPNLLGKRLGADVTNISRSGNTNVGIFLDALKEFTTNKYDLILLQTAQPFRIVLSRKFGNAWAVSEDNPNSYLIDDTSYRTFHKVFATLNQGHEHWHQLMNIIVSVQNLVKQGYNIRFVNVGIDWNQEFFNHRNSQFARDLVDFDSLPDDQIAEAFNILDHDKKLINLDLWISPLERLWNLKVDTISEEFPSAGIKTHVLCTNIIYDQLSKDNTNK